MTQRILFSLGLILSFLFLPFYISAVLGILGIVLFRWYAELLVLGFFADSLFGVVDNRFFAYPFVYIVSIAILIFIFELVRPYVRVRER